MLQNSNITDFDDCEGLHDPATSRRCKDGFYPYTFPEMSNRKMSKIAYGRILPFLITLAALTNVVMVKVLSRVGMRTVTNLILTNLAVAELMVGLLPFPFMLYYYTLEDVLPAGSTALSPGWCWFAKISTDALPPVFHNCAIWLTVLLAVQRLMLLRQSLSGSRSFWTFGKVKVVSILIVVLSCISALPKLADISEFQVINVVESQENNSLQWTESCIYRPTQLRNQIGPDLFYGTYMGTRVIVFCFIPSCLLSVVTFCLILDLRKSQKRSKKLLPLCRLRTRQTSRTSMLIAIVLIFLAVNLPQGIILCAVCVAHLANLTLNNNALVFASVVDNMLILATYPLNFAIYCSMSSQFRQNLKDMLNRAQSISRSSFQMSGTLTSHLNRGNTINSTSKRSFTLSVRLKRSILREEHDLEAGDFVSSL